MTFGWALAQVKEAKAVTRPGWNGKGMFLFLVTSYYCYNDLPKVLPTVHYKPWIAMKTADDGVVPWLASQTDILAEDWEFYEKV